MSTPTMPSPAAGYTSLHLSSMPHPPSAPATMRAATSHGSRPTSQQQRRNTAPKSARSINRPSTAQSQSSFQFATVAPTSPKGQSPSPPTSPPVVRSMLEASHVPQSKAQKWQTFQSPSGRLRELEKQIRSKRNDPYATRWQTSTEYKHVNIPSAIEGIRNQTCDYAAINSKLSVQQAAEANAREALRAASEYADRERLEQTRAEELREMEEALLREEQERIEARENSERRRSNASASSSPATAAHRRAMRSRPPTLALPPAHPRAASLLSPQRMMDESQEMADVAAHALLQRSAQPTISQQQQPPVTRIPSTAEKAAALKEAAALKQKAERKAHILRLDVEESDDFGEEIILPTDEELEQMEQKQQQPQQQPEEHKEQIVSPRMKQLVHPRIEANEVIETEEQSEFEPLSSPHGANDDEDEDHTLALADATLSMVMEQQEKGVTRSGVRQAVSLDEVAAAQSSVAPNLRRLDSAHPYHKEEMARARAQGNASAVASPSHAGSQVKHSIVNAITHNSRTYASASTEALAAEIALDYPLPPATMRLYPPALLDEVDEAHRILGEFIAKCQKDTMYLKNDPHAMVQVYFQNFQAFLQSHHLDAHGFPMYPVEPTHEQQQHHHRKKSQPPIVGTVATTPAVPLPQVTLCASYLLVKLGESGIFSSYHTGLLMKLLNTLFFSVYDVTFEEASATYKHTSLTPLPNGLVEQSMRPCKRTPFFTRLKHLQTAFQDVERYKVRTENRLKYNLRSLRMVIAHSHRRFAYLCFRAWKYQVQIEKRRQKLFHLSMKKNKPRATFNSKSGVLVGSGGGEITEDVELVRAFFFWRSIAKTNKLERLLSLEVQKLHDILSKIQSESNIARENNVALSENIQMMMVKLHKLEEERLTAPLKPDPIFSQSFMESIFDRCAKELEFMKEMDLGFIPLYKLAPRFAKFNILSGGGGADIGSTTDALLRQLSGLARKDRWESRSVLFHAIEIQRKKEEQEENKNQHELAVMDTEDFIILWANYLLENNNNANSSSNLNSPTVRSPAAGGVSSFSGKRRYVRDLSTDLRDSTVYMQLLQVLGPELPTHKVDKLSDLHSKAKLILSLSAMMGCRFVLNEFEYVEGMPDLHLLFLGSLFLCRHGMGAEPRQKWFQHKASRITMLRDHWNHIRTMDNVPPITAYSYMGHLYQLCNEVDVQKQRLLRRQAFYIKMRTRVKNFLWSIQRARVLGIEEELYHVKHMDNKYHNYIESGTIEQLLNSDPARIKHRLKYEHKQLSQTSGMNLTKRERHQLVLQDEELIEHEIAVIKRVFANNRVELKKIQKHYSTDAVTNTLRPGIDFENFLSFCKDCGFLFGRDKIPLATLHDIFHSSILPSAEEQEERARVEQEALAAQTMNVPTNPDDNPNASTSSSLSSTSLLTPSQFLDAIIRIANIKYAPSFPESLSARVKECIERDVLSGASRTVVDEFRKQIASETVRLVFKANKGRLSSLFRRYATLDQLGPPTPLSAATSPVAAARLFRMKFQQFLEMMSDAQILPQSAMASPKSSTMSAGGSVATPTMTEAKLRVLFQNVQQDEDFGEHEEGQSDSLTYQEFLETLAALACMIFTDPFLSLANKIEHFIEGHLFVQLKKAAFANQNNTNTANRTQNVFDAFEF